MLWQAMEAPVFSVFGGQDTTAGGQLADAMEVMESLAKKANLPYMLRCVNMLILGGRNPLILPGVTMGLTVSHAHFLALPHSIFKDEDGSFVLKPRQGFESAAENALTLAVSWLEIQMRAGGRPRVIRDARVC